MIANKNRKSPSVLKAVVGQLNLIEYDATEVKIPAFRIVPNDGYVSVNRTNDIALIEVGVLIANSFKEEKENALLHFFS